MDDSNIEHSLVKRVDWLLQHRLVVVEEEEEGHLVQDELLSQADVQVVGLYLPKSC